MILYLTVTNGVTEHTFRVRHVYIGILQKPPTKKLIVTLVDFEDREILKGMGFKCQGLVTSFDKEHVLKIELV